MQQEDILNRYRHLRAISARHHNAALDCVARPAILERAKHLGLACGHSLLPGSAEEMALVFDLAVHTAKSGRSRAIDRYARAATASSDPDDALTLEALRRTRFSVWRTERHHETTGLIVTDMLRDGETWLIDEGLAASAEPGLAFASRLFWPAEFAMTCGILVPIDAKILARVVLDGIAWMQHVDLGRSADDPRFAMGIYRAAVDEGVMDGVVFQESFAAA